MRLATIVALGLTATLVAGCNVSGSRPVVKIISVNGTVLPEGGNSATYVFTSSERNCTVNFEAQAVDAEDGNLGGAQIVWRVSDPMAAGGATFTQFDIGADATLVGACDTPVVEGVLLVSRRNVVVTVTDSDGNANVDSIRLEFRSPS